MSFVITSFKLLMRMLRTTPVVVDASPLVSGHANGALSSAWWHPDFTPHSSSLAWPLTSFLTISAIAGYMKARDNVWQVRSDPSRCMQPPWSSASVSLAGIVVDLANAFKTSKWQSYLVRLDLFNPQNHSIRLTL
jgi:hypothetical protein